MQKAFQIVLDFGYSTMVTAHSSIDDLAACAESNYRQHPNIITLAQSASYAQLLTNRIIPPKQLSEIQVGQSDTNGTSGGGSYHVLRAAAMMLAFVSASDRQEIFLVAHQAHTPRAIRQGRLFQLNLVPARNLPTTFYEIADQWWCRGPLLWKLREMIGYWPLKLCGQL